MERQWRTLNDSARSMMRFAGLSRAYWALALSAAAWIRNRVVSGATDAIPFQLVMGAPPDLTNLRVFGCPAYVHVDKGQRRKLDDKAWKGVFVGYAEDACAWLVYNPRTRRVVLSRDVVFDEASLLSCSLSMHEGEDSMLIVHGENTRHAVSITVPEAVESVATTTHTTEPADENRPPGEDAAPVEQSALRSTRPHNPPGEWWVSDVPSAHMATAKRIPRSYAEAVRSEDNAKWIEATNLEYEALVKNDTWRLV